MTSSATPTDQTVYSAHAGFTVVPSDTTVFASAHRAIYVGGAGDVKVRMLRDGTTLTFSAVPVGTLLPIAVDMVFNTGTTATLMVALR